MAHCADDCTLLSLSWASGTLCWRLYTAQPKFSKIKNLKICLSTYFCKLSTIWVNRWKMCIVVFHTDAIVCWNKVFKSSSEFILLNVCWAVFVRWLAHSCPGIRRTDAHMHTIIHYKCFFRYLPCRNVLIY